MDEELLTHKREGKKIDKPFATTPKPLVKSGGFSMTVMEMEELAAYKAALKVASEALIKISDTGERYGYGRCECSKCTACLAHETLKQLYRMGVKF